MCIYTYVDLFITQLVCFCWELDYSTSLILTEEFHLTYGGFTDSLKQL